VDRVSGDVCVPISEIDIDHDEVVDVIQVISDLVCSEFAANTSDYQIARRSASNLVRHMARYVKLTIGPTELELRNSQLHTRQ